MTVSYSLRSYLELQLDQLDEEDVSARRNDGSFDAKASINCTLEYVYDDSDNIGIFLVVCINTFICFIFVFRCGLTATTKTLSPWCYLNIFICVYCVPLRGFSTR